ncbi:ABC transporter substrate-binding protein [Stella sp.]|uniref:ABC transporter substrate-binding protein n=1 Tax=Stella sp. TaxID=2912054 RepID=UPI0035B0E55E
MNRFGRLTARSIGRGAALSLVALAMVAGPAAAQQRGGVIKVASDAPPVGLDPHIAIPYSSLAAYEHVYETLVRFNADMELEPALAQSYSQPDDLTYEFKLRPGVKFHDGEPMTAEAVKFSFDRILDPATGSPRASLMSPIKEVKVVDPGTVRVTMKEPFPAFLTIIASQNYAAIVSPKAAASGELQTKPVGTGPFRFTRYETGVRIVYTRFEDYWDKGKPYVDGLEFTFTRDETARIAGLRRATAHIGWVREPRLAQLLERERHLTIQQSSPIRHQRLFFRTDRPPFDNVLVRQAVSAATNRDEIIKTVLLGFGTHSAALPPGMPPYAVPAKEVMDLPYQKYDPELAKKLLAQAGLPNGFEFTFLTSPQGFDYVTTAEVLQNQWARVGIKINIESVDWSAAMQRWRGKDFTAFLIASAWAPDPDNQVTELFHSKSTANYYGHNDPKLDALLDAQRTMTKLEERAKAWREIQRYVAETAPALFLYAMSPRYEAVDRSVQGYRFMANASRSYLREAWLKK